MWTLERLIDTDPPHWEILTQHPRQQDAEDKMLVLRRRIEHQRSMSGHRILDYRVRDIGQQLLENGAAVES